jgi:hypothetical protein
MPIAALSCQPSASSCGRALLCCGLVLVVSQLASARFLASSLMSLQPPAHVSYMVLFGGTDCLVHTIVETDQLRVDGSR